MICRPDSELLDRLATALVDCRSDLTRRWDEDHDGHVAREVIQRIEPEFQPQAWQAFRRVALEGADPEVVAAELELSLASVYAAKSRVLRRFRQETRNIRFDVSEIARSSTSKRGAEEGG